MLNMVERLLVSEGTSSTEMRTSGGCSLVVLDDTVRLSLNEEADVPRRGVSNERGRPGEEDENVDVWYVSGVIIGGAMSG